MATDVSEVVQELKAGGIAAFPTETLWSLSCRADDKLAVQRIFEMKRRPAGVPLAVGVADWKAAASIVESTAGADALAQQFLPGPLTIVLPRKGKELQHLAPNNPTLGVRVPDNDIAQAVLAGCQPLVMTSANLHGAPNPRTAEGVRGHFPDIPIVGEVVPGEASTVVDGVLGRVLREGMISKAEVAAAWP